VFLCLPAGREFCGQQEGAKMNSCMEQEFTNNIQVAAAKKLLTVTKSVDSTAQAVDSIISECITAADSQDIEPFDVFHDWKNDAVELVEHKFANGFDHCEFLQNAEPIAEWNEDKKSYTTLENAAPHEVLENKALVPEIHSTSAKEFDWLMNFKIGKLLDPIKDDYGPNDGMCVFCFPIKKKIFLFFISTPNKLCDFLENQNIFQLLKAKNCEQVKPSPPPPPIGPKPPFTYTELIEQALEEKGALTVSGIYQWIS